MQVGLFFFINNDFAFVGCDISQADNYGDFLVYDESHFDVWERLSDQALINGMRVDYDYYPRGRVVYRKTDNTFVIYYDKCLEHEIEKLVQNYEGYECILELDEHYCCHSCNPDYVV